MLTVNELINTLLTVNDNVEVRIGDVAEGHDLHCSIGQVVERAGCVVFVPGDDDVWKDETLSSEVLMKILWPEIEEEEDNGEH